MRDTDDRALAIRPHVAITANLLVLALAACAALLVAGDADLYYRSVQEDEALEWGSFWAFLLAGVAFGTSAWRGRREGWRGVWVPLGLAAFCVAVAMEEISWGQRLLGYRPPVYFLESNFQQEFNFHNVIDKSLRKLALKSVILGYGVVLPCLGLLRPLRLRLSRIGVELPPLALVPAFAITFLVYQSYPWKYAGEWVEAMLGLGFLFAALLSPGLHFAPRRPTLRLAAAWLAVLALGFASAAFLRGARSRSPELAQNASTEIQALVRDFQSGALDLKCGLHRRLYTFFEKSDQAYLRQGSFAAMTAQGLPPERADFLLDPWNSPYWIRYRCGDGGRKRAFVYSFGPNRKRDSSRWEILGDDVGGVIVERGFDNSRQQRGRARRIGEGATWPRE